MNIVSEQKKLCGGVAYPTIEEGRQEALRCWNEKITSNDRSAVISDSDLKPFFLSALCALQDKDYQAAEDNMRYYGAPFESGFFAVYPYLYYYRALIAYGKEDYSLAERCFHAYLQAYPQAGEVNEAAYLHLGNAHFRQGQMEKALDAYETALMQRNNFPEVSVNIALAALKLGDEETAKALAKDEALFERIFRKGTLCESPLEYSLAIPDDLSIWDIPIFINSRDRLVPLRRLVDWLVAAGYRRIYILDNDSTYPPLLDYYRQLDDNETAVKVLRLKRNLGHKALWLSGILDILHVSTPYVYTDSDVVPSEDCPTDILGELLDTLRKYAFLKKVGLGLKVDDITFFDAEGEQEEEKRLYQCRLEDELFFGTIYTTFALYRNIRHYSVEASARTIGKNMARHSQWYLDYACLPEDEKYYFDHANESAKLVSKIKEAMQYFVPRYSDIDAMVKKEDGLSEALQEFPLVSVIMPVYNGEKYLAEAIDSILRQTYINWELLAVDDGSTDNSLSILQMYAKRDCRIRILLHEVNKGLPAARNTGIRNAKGKYVALMDADDISMPKRLAMQTAFMERHSEVDVCGTFGKTFGAVDGRFFLKPIWDREIKINLLFVCTFVSASAMMRVDSLKRHQLYFDESWKIVEDYEFWCRAANRLVYHNLPYVLYLYRIIASSLSKANPERMILATQTIIARNLNEISECKMKLPALYNIECTDEDWMTVINELSELPFHLEESCPFSTEEVRLVSDFLIQQCKNIIEMRRVNTVHDC